MFDLAANPPEPISFPGLRSAPLNADGGEAKLDLTLHLQETGGPLAGHIAGHIEYRPTLFEPATVQRLAGYLTAILESAAAAPGRRLAEIPMLSEAERHQALVERNERRLDRPEAGTLFPEMLFPQTSGAQARRNPEAMALLFEGQGEEGSVTYRELADRAGRLARFLAERGIGPGALAAVCMDRSPHLIEAILGILQAGGGYVPLEPDLPRERMELMLRDSGARLLITRASLLPLLPDLVPVLCLDRDAERISGAGGKESNEGEPNTAPSPHDPAYVMYTSGSTGQPKGVVVPHRALAWLTRTAIDQYHLKPADRMLQMSSIGFDISVEEIFPSLATGAVLCLCSDPLLRSPGFFLERCRQWGVTGVSVPTAFWHLLVDEIAGGRSEIPSSLRLLVIGGESASPAHLDLWRAQAGPGVRLVNTYGPTETTVAATLRDLRDPAAGADRAPVPIGRPIRGAEVYLLDAGLQPVPAGVSGEIFLGGGGCARGYLGRPDLTAERFVPHPFAAAPGERLYRTGDLARSLPDGDLEFAGRTDRQVKIRGFRVEPGEVDAVLCTHPEVRASVTLLWEPAPGDRRLVTWFVPRTDSMAVPELRSFLQKRLPAYMIPASLEPIEAIPLTPNGKVDRRALPDPQGGTRTAAESYAAPSDPVEAKLAAVWAEVLRIDRIGVHDNFFALGGHSLLATQVVSRVREALGVELPLRRLFETPTIHQLTRGLRAEPAVNRGAPVLTSGAVEAEAGVPLSFAQQRLWLLDQLEPGNPAYNLPLAVRLSGELSVAALARTFAEMVRRHAALRTTFAVRDGQPVQVIAPPDAARPELRALDLSEALEETREEWARELALEEALHPFDLERGPLLRLGLLRLAGREHLLLVTLHHVVADGWSMGVLLREIGILYPAFLRGEPSPLPELALQYADFARWQREQLQGEVLERQLAHWKEALAGAPALLDLPTDRPRPAVQTYRGGAVGLTLPPALSEAVRELCRGREVTPFMLLLTVWAVLLGRHASQDDVLIGSPIAGRNRREIEDLIGFFVNTLVLRTDLSGNLNFTELLRRVRETALDAFAHQDLPFERIVEAEVSTRDLAHAPLFQVFFALQNAPVQSLSVPGLSLAPLALETGRVKFDLSLDLGEAPSGFSGGLEYNSDLFDRMTAERLRAHFVNLLASAVADPGLPLADLRLMDATEERLLCSVLDPAESAWSLPAAVHDLFARQAAKTPGNTAAVGPRGAVTYREVAERSTALAVRIRRVLSKSGSSELDRGIGLLADPDPQVPIGMIGILEAGGGFVPLDPRHPEERLAWILEDCACEVLVTQRRHLEQAERLAAGIAGLCHVLCLEDTVFREQKQAARETRDPDDLRSLAYVVYTSGSTGRPKGVQISHESLVPVLLWGCEHLGLGEHTRVLQSLSFGFDFGIFEHLTTLLAGGTLCYLGEAAGDPAASAREIVRRGANTLHATPAFARELAATGETLESLEIIHLGGEALPWDTVARLHEAAPRATVYNGYGPTEATVNSSMFRVDRHIRMDHHGGSPEAGGWPVVPIGRRSADNALYVLDRAGRVSPWGARGELHVGGIGVARGYLGRPALTAERFVPDPFGAAPGGRLYRTGDRVRLRADGELEFLGRIDTQVKLRGFRIEPGEIEAALRSHPEVSDCVALVRQDAPGDPRLVAYLTLRTALLDPAAILSAWLRDKLPGPMVPSAFVVLEALPLTSNGKIDRRALPAAPQRADPSLYVPPGDAMEEKLAVIWQEVLRLERVGVHDDFFASGGHSMLATQVVTRVRELLGVEIPLRRVFEAPTIRQLSRSLR
jgi:amino acid adenylation domain-containing protein